MNKIDLVRMYYAMALTNEMRAKGLTTHKISEMGIREANGAMMLAICGLRYHGDVYKNNNDRQNSPGVNHE